MTQNTQKKLSPILTNLSDFRTIFPEIKGMKIHGDIVLILFRTLG